MQCFYGKVVKKDHTRPSNAEPPTWTVSGTRCYTRSTTERTTSTAGEARKDRRSPTASSRVRIAVDALDIGAAPVLVESASASVRFGI